MAVAWTRIVSAVLIALLGASPAVAAVCESFCPAHQPAVVEVVSHHGASHHGGHHAAEPTHDRAAEPGPRIAPPAAGCCGFPDAQGQTLTATRLSSLRDDTAVPSAVAPATPKATDALLYVDADLPTRPPGRAPAFVVLRI